MVLRSKPLWVVIASCFVLFQGDFAHAEPKPARGARGELTKPRSGAGPGAGAPAKPAAAPEPPAIKAMAVCVRPQGMDEKVQRWTFDETNKPVATNIDEMARKTHNRIYVFDAKASLDSPKLLPLPHSQQKCKGDTRQPPPPEAPKPAGFLPPSGPLFAPAHPLNASAPVFSPGSLSSSGTGKSTAALIQQFVQQSENYDAGTTSDAILASKFAEQLRSSILTKKPLAEIEPKDLSPGAAIILMETFKETLPAAIAQQPVIAPLNALQKIVPAGKNPGWSTFVLVDDHWMTDREMNAPNEAAAVLLTTADHQYWTGVVTSLVPGPMPADMLHLAYKKAYASKPDWIHAVAAYFP